MKMDKNTALSVPADMGKDAELERRLPEFLEQDRFVLVIQPVVDFRDGSVVNGEALCRLEHPELGTVFPDRFLPVLDALGLYGRFDRYIFHKACVWMRRVREQGRRFDCISCNFSRKTLSEPTLARDLIRIADSCGVSYRRLGLEITEQEREPDPGQMRENLARLRAAGFRVILDDYGNGVTSAQDLRRYPVDILKLDRSVLLNTETQKGRDEFCEMVDTAVRLGAEVVCEGIETREQDRFVREAGCRYGQGYLYFRPLSQDRVLALLEQGSIREGSL